MQPCASMSVLLGLFATAPSPVPFPNPAVPSSYPPTLDSSSTPYSGPIDPSLRGFDPAPRGYDTTPRASDTAPRPVEAAVPGVDNQLRGADPAPRGPEQAVHSQTSDAPSAAFSQTKQEGEGPNTGEQQQPQHQQHPPKPRGGWNTSFP